MRKVLKQDELSFKFLSEFHPEVATALLDADAVVQRLEERLEYWKKQRQAEAAEERSGAEPHVQDIIDRTLQRQIEPRENEIKTLREAQIQMVRFAMAIHNEYNRLAVEVDEALHMSEEDLRREMQRELTRDASDERVRSAVSNALNKLRNIKLK
jgi:hypothetical protein